MGAKISRVSRAMRRRLSGRNEPQGAHVMGAVGELDQDDPDVLGHGHHHLAEVLDLGFLAIAEFQLVELGTPDTSSATALPNSSARSSLVTGYLR